jgi:hypothetical protein
MQTVINIRVVYPLPIKTSIFENTRVFARFNLVCDNCLMHIATLIRNMSKQCDNMMKLCKFSEGWAAAIHNGPVVLLQTQILSKALRCPFICPA